MQLDEEVPQAAGEIVAQDLVVKRGSRTVLDGLSFTLRAGVITGLVGPNAVGKTTLAATIAGRIKPTSGSVTLDGVAVFDNPQAMPSVTLVGDGCDYAPRGRVVKSVQIWAAMKPRWDADMAANVLHHFGVGLKDVPSRLSLGQRSGISMAIGLAANTPVTIFDEVTVGLDPTNRERFTEAILGSYAAQPRTIVLASHLIDEIENTVEDIVVLSADGIAFHGSVESLRQAVVTVTGAPEVVSRVLGDRRVLRSRDLGPVKQVAALVDDELRAAAAVHQLTVQTVSLQESVIALTWNDAKGAQ